MTISIPNGDPRAYAASVVEIGCWSGERRRRSWPYPATRLEVLAKQAGISDDELRVWLRRRIAECLRAEAGYTSARVKVICPTCGCAFALSERRSRAIALTGKPPVCPECRSGQLDPGARERARLAKLDGKTRGQALEGLAALR
jgi:Zn finger protein HypA/HybF involved in hydrogenase expression